MEALEVECDVKMTSPVEAVAKRNGQTWVFAKHPDRKPRFVDEILEEFEQ
jgi:hypothetical protein